MSKYDPKIIEGHFDESGEREWGRLDRDPIGKVQFHIHKHYLQKYIKKGNIVLDIGAGPGRFTIELAELGASIGVVDISDVQLQLNEAKVKEAGFENSIQWRKKLDILNLEDIPDNSFDAVVCYGGPLSYVLEYIDEALEEVLRVTKPLGFVLASVMSCLGTYHHLLENVFETVKKGELDLENLDNLTRTGDVVGELANRGTHQCHMFRWSEMKQILDKHPIDIMDVSSCNFLSTGLIREEKLNEIMNDSELWKTFLKWELEFSKEPGAIDGGTHMLVVLRKHDLK